MSPEVRVAMLVVVGQLGLVAGMVAQGLGPSTGGAVALEHERRMVGHHRRVLMIAAHPDDENTEVLTVLARGHGAETAYLSLTRGEGGQNLLGPELGDGLGLIRTGELLAAREIDGARQFFTRAADYGFSKTVEEAWRFWPRDSVLKDAVRIIRRFRPQLLISVFTGTPLDGHGQHQAAGWIAAEAFRVAGDPAAFPELEREEGLAPFTPLKLYRSSRFDAGAPMVGLDGGALDAVVGQSFRQIAMRSRSLHRSQDQGSLQEMGPSTVRLQLLEDRAGGGPELWAGIDTAPRPEDPDQERRAGRVRAIESGLIFDLTVDDARVVPGQVVSGRLSVWNAGAAPVSVSAALTGPAATWLVDGACLRQRATVEPNTLWHCGVTLKVPDRFRWSIPYFLETPRTGAMYQWGGLPADHGEPFEPEPVRASFEITLADGTRFPVAITATNRVRDQAFGEVRRAVQVVPRVGVRLDPVAGVWTPGGAPRELVVTLQHGARDTTRGSVTLALPSGWAPVPAQRFELDREDEQHRIGFSVRPPAGISPGRYEIRAAAVTDQGERFDLGLTVIDYPHITSRLLPRPAVMAVQVAEVALPDVGVIGYVRGASDLVPEALREAGLAVDLLDREALARGDLGRYRVIVIGSRAYETDTTLVEQHSRLIAWVRAGGRLVVQYQQQTYFNGGFAPYSLALAPRGHDRVTDEEAPMVMLRPDASLFRTPNRIDAGDWVGWVQERGLYFARSWDPAWTPLLESHDPGEEPLRGGLLAARLGQGTYLYTGLSFFRQLPAAVPGALRLFLNLLAYSHPDATP